MYYYYYYYVIFRITRACHNQRRTLAICWFSIAARYICNFFLLSHMNLLVFLLSIAWSKLDLLDVVLFIYSRKLISTILQRWQAMIKRNSLWSNKSNRFKFKMLIMTPIADRCSTYLNH